MFTPPLAAVAARSALALLIALAGPARAGVPAPSAPQSAPLPDPLAAGWHGHRVCAVLHEDADNRILRCTFPPGGGHERHFHPRHFGYVLAGGRMRLTEPAGVREVTLTAGTSFPNAGVAWHEVLNIGETTVVYLLVEPR